MRCSRRALAIVGLVVMLAAVTSPVAEVPKCNGYLYNGLSTREPKEPTEVLQQPNGPFAVVLFNEDALSTFIGVLYFKAMTNPIDGAWKIDDRFWQKGDWVSDVTSFAWGKSGKYLYVGTMNVYGDGGLFKLDLLNRKSERLFPSDDILRKSGLYGSSYATEIVAIDLARSRMTVELAPQDPEDIKKGLKPVQQELEFQ